MEYNFEYKKLLSLINKWKYHLIIVLVVATVAASIFSGPRFITPMYRSFAIVYPANLKPYSKESTTEQMIQIFQSQGIEDSMIAKYNLAKRYNINPRDKYFRTELLRLYRKSVSISKTNYEAVKISVLDKNPDTAKLMADDLIALFNKKVSKMKRQKYREAVNAFKGQLNREKTSLDSLRGVLKHLGKMGIFEYNYQSQQIMKAFLRNAASGSEKEREAKTLMQNMGKYSGDLVQTVRLLSDQSGSYSKTKMAYENEYRNLVAHITYTYIVTYPFVPDKKSYPVRWLIVVVSDAAVMALAFLLIVFLDRKTFSVS